MITAKGRLERMIKILSSTNEVIQQQEKTKKSYVLHFIDRNNIAMEEGIPDN